MRFRRKLSYANFHQCSLIFTVSCFKLQKVFSFSVRDSLLNVGPLKDFAYGLRINADPNATGIAKQSNYELVSVAGYNFLCALQYVFGSQFGFFSF